MESLNITGIKRADVGTKFAKATRKEGRIPCVLYGQDGIEHFSIIKSEIKGMVYTPDFKLAELDIDGNTTKAILKDIQFHPVTDEIVHVDFLKLTDGVPVKVSLPLRTKGASVGVKSGGKLIQQVRHILVKTMPENLVEELFVDISALELGQSVRVRDIEISDNMQIMNPAATPVAMVEIPRALRSAQASEEEGKEAVAE